VKPARRQQIAELEAALGRELRAIARLDPRATRGIAKHKVQAAALRRRINQLVLELASKEEQ
jgi:hypothetical protein